MRTLYYPIRVPRAGCPGTGNACLRSGLPMEAGLPSARNQAARQIPRPELFRPGRGR